MIWGSLTCSSTKSYWNFINSCTGNLNAMVLVFFTEKKSKEVKWSHKILWNIIVAAGVIAGYVENLRKSFTEKLSDFLKKYNFSQNFSPLQHNKIEPQFNIFWNGCWSMRTNISSWLLFAVHNVGNFQFDQYQVLVTR